MPFGDGKNTVYTFNPNCALFTLQQQRPDGSWRTIAQSVLTKDKDVGKNFADILEQVQSAQTPQITDILDEEVLRSKDFTLACDNVQTAPNIKENVLIRSHIEMIYRDFFAEYLSRYAQAQNLDARQVVVGMGYSDTLKHLPKIPNNFIPAAPVSYSDKTHRKVFQLIPETSSTIQKTVREKPEPELEIEFDTTTSITGIDSLTFEDSLAVAFIEGKAYRENEDLMKYIHNMENGLIAKDINNVSKNRPNMSLKYVGEDKKIRGYMLAYEGRGEEDQLKDQPVIYISDLAADLKKKGVGGALIRGFFELYKRHYVDNKDRWEGDKPIPIFFEAREKTSYAIIRKNLGKYAQELELNLEMEELDTYQQGNDTMHKLIIKVKT